MPEYVDSEFSQVLNVNRVKFHQWNKTVEHLQQAVHVYIQVRLIAILDILNLVDLLIKTDDFILKI